MNYVTPHPTSTVYSLGILKARWDSSNGYKHFDGNVMFFAIVDIVAIKELSPPDQLSPLLMAGDPKKVIESPDHQVNANLKFQR